MEKHDFKLVGLGRPRSITLEHLENDRDTFWAVSTLTEDRFNALWDFFPTTYGNSTLIAEVECDRLSEDGTPINARLVGTRLK